MNGSGMEAAKPNLGLTGRSVRRHPEELRGGPWACTLCGCEGPEAQRAVPATAMVGLSFAWCCTPRGEGLSVSSGSIRGQLRFQDFELQEPLQGACARMPCCTLEDSDASYRSLTRLRVACA